MSRNPKPTVEELRFVYELLSRGYDEKSVIEEYNRLERSGVRIYPIRQDVRFVRERKKELMAAQEVLKEKLSQKYNPLNIESKKQHYEHLADVARLLLDGGLERLDGIKIGDKYQIVSEGYKLEELTQNELVGRLECNLDIAYQKHGYWQVDGCLFKHVEAEYPICEDIYGFIETNPMEFIDIIRILAQRKTFKGNCPVCKDWK